MNYRQFPFPLSQGGSNFPSNQFPSFPGMPFPGGQPGFPGGQPGFPGGQPGFPGGQPGFPGGQPGFPGGQPGFPGGQPGFPGGSFPGNEQGGSPPTSPPPSFTPQQSSAQLFAVDPGAIRGCLFRNTYVWLNNGDSFWYFPTFVGRTSVAGWRWRRRFGWVFFGIDLRSIQSFQCF